VPISDIRDVANMTHRDAGGGAVHSIKSRH
jgi:hypothetical protein